MTASDRYPQLLGGRQGTFAAWTPERTISSGTEAIARLESWGIRVPPGARLRRAVDDLRRIEQFDVRLGHGDPATERLASEATRTIYELHIILADLLAPDQMVKRKLRKVLGGKSVPTAGDHDPARDTQAELFAAALLFGAGFGARIAEPDLLIGVGTLNVPVAVKRMTSDTHFEKRMREALKQLTKAGKPGYIVIAADQYLERLYAIDRSADVSAAHYKKVAELVDGLRLEPETSMLLGGFGISTSCRHVPTTDRSLALTVHFHQRFITWGTPERIQKAEESGRIMAGNLSTMLTRTFAVSR